MFTLRQEARWWVQDMKRRELFRLLSFLLVLSLVGAWIDSVFGPMVSIVWTAIALPAGYIMGRSFRRRRRQAMIEEWRNTHPGLSDYWLPKELR